MTVHSTRLALGSQNAGTSATVYSVPTGYRTILKSVTLINTHGAANRFKVLIFHGGSQIGYFAYNVGAGGTTAEWVHDQPWVVLMPGDSIKVDSAFDGFDWVISGTELLL